MVDLPTPIRGILVPRTWTAPVPAQNHRSSANAQVLPGSWREIGLGCCRYALTVGCRAWRLPRWGGFGIVDAGSIHVALPHTASCFAHVASRRAFQSRSSHSARKQTRVIAALASVHGRTPVQEGHDFFASVCRQPQSRDAPPRSRGFVLESLSGGRGCPFGGPRDRSAVPYTCFTS